MPITEYQREQRRKHLGSSDMAAVLGVSPWANAHDIWLDKTGRLMEREPSEAMLAGSFLEEGILLYAESKLGKIKRNQYRAIPEYHLGANVDAIALDCEGEPIEVKKVEFTSPSFDAWGDQGTDQVPDEVIIQTHVHMLCQSETIQVGRCHVAGLVGGRLGMWVVPFNRDLATTICDAAVNFWGFVTSDTPPAAVTPSLESLKRYRRTPGKIVTINPALVLAFQAAQKATKEAEANETAARANLLVALADKEGGADGGDAGEVGMVTYMTQSRTGLDAVRIQKEHPELYREYMKTSTFPVLRIKAKKGK